MLCRNFFWQDGQAKKKKVCNRLLTLLFRECIMPILVCAPVAQLDRVPGYELGGREFESLRARHL